MTERCCLNPFRWLDITAYSRPGENNIQFSQCIRSWGGDECVLLSIPLSEACKMDVAALRNSQRSREARSEVATSGFASWCKGCPRRREKISPTQPRDSVDWNTLPQSWTTLNLAYDKSCNLACPSCRTDKICVKRGDEQYRMLMEFQDRIIRPLLRHAETACLAGLGDPFGSPVYRHLLETLTPEEAPRLGWHIQTNGIGFTPWQLRRIPTRERINSVQFSLDAAKMQTYRLLRGKQWPEVIRNLAFAGKLRKSGRLNQFAISMVVQECNWGEMDAFWRLGKSHGVDIVQFNALLNQNTYSEEDYLARAVHLAGHQVYNEFMAACDRLREYANPKVLMEFPRE